MRIEPLPSVMFEDLGGESVLLEMERGYYYGLDAVGTSFWTLISAGNDLDGAVDQLVTIYEVDRDVLRSDLVALVTELQDAGLVKVDGDA